MLNAEFAGRIIGGEKSSYYRGLSADLFLFIKGSKTAFTSCVYLFSIQCLQFDMKLKAPKKNSVYEGKFGKLN